MSLLIDFTANRWDIVNCKNRKEKISTQRGVFEAHKNGLKTTPLYMCPSTTANKRYKTKEP